MSDTAIISFLWTPNVTVLESYLSGRNRVVIVPQILCTSTIQEGIAKAGGRLQVLEQLVSEASIRGLQAEAKRKAEKFFLLTQGNAWQDFCHEHQACPEKLAECIGKNMQQRIFLEMLYIQALNAARAAYAIELMVVNEDYQSTPRIATQWANSAGIPSVHILHGLLAMDFVTVHRSFYADKILVPGERSKEAYLDIGCEPERLVLTGFPPADAYVEKKEKKAFYKKMLAEKYGFDPSLPLVTFGTTWTINLSAVYDPEIYDKTVSHFFAACKALKLSGLKFHIIIKDRPPNAVFGKERMEFIANIIGFDMLDYTFTWENTQEVVTASDVLFSVDSSLSVEAMMVGTPAISYLHDMGLRLGPGFEGMDGVTEATPDQLAKAIYDVITNSEHRHKMLSRAADAVLQHNIGVDGKTLERCVEVLSTVALKQPQTKPEPNAIETGYVWQEYLDVEEIEATGYHGGARADLVDMFTNNPRFVIDIGCSGGGTGALVKQKYPEAVVWGIETNRAAAEIASTKLDRVLIGKFEDFNLEAEGVLPGTLDGVIVADVLEHMYNPWRVMTTLRPFLSSSAQVISSIPNVRNIKLMEDLSCGYWRYESLGLLDVTHIRFFTYKEILRFYHETGYHVTKTVCGIDGRLRDLYQQHVDKCPTDVEVGRMVIRDVTRAELDELCSLQFYMVVEPGGLQSDIDKYYEVPQKIQLYEHWRNNRFFTSTTTEFYQKRMEEWIVQPLFHIVVIVSGEKNALLGETIRSLTDQYYYNIRISIISDLASPSGLEASERFEWIQATDNNAICDVNRILLASPAHWVGILEAGDLVAAHSFLLYAEAAHSHPEWRVIYSDEDTITKEGAFDRPVFKPDYNLDMLRSQAYIGGLMLIQQSLFVELGGYDKDLPGVEEYDFALRASEKQAVFGHVADVLYHRREGSGHCLRPLADLVEDGQSALRSHLFRLGANAEVVTGIYPGSHRVIYNVDAQPLVSILIPVSGECLALLQRCLDSVLSKTHYTNYEILILDNGCKEEGASQYLNGVESIGGDKIRVYTLPERAPLAQCFNLLSSEAQGELLVFMHYDAAPVAADWLHEMVGHLSRQEVGMASPRLLRADGKVREAGYVVGLNGSIGPLLPGISTEYSGYYGRAHIVQDFTVLPAGCLGVKAELFNLIGGFDPEYFSETLYEADICLRISKAGYLNVWTPFANILCEGRLDGAAWVEDESSREKELLTAQNQFAERWWSALAHDAAYNDNFTLIGEPFFLEDRTAITWRPLTWHPVPRVLAHHGDEAGCGEYRILAPVRTLVNGGKIDGFTSNRHFSNSELARFSPDLILCQRQILEHQRNHLQRYKRFSGAKIVFELDDLMTNVPLKSPHYDEIPKDIELLLRKSVELCDFVTLTTEALAHAYRDMHHDIRIIPNFLENARWENYMPQRQVGQKPRVGWAGSISHVGDLELIQDIVKELSKEVDWVFFGLCPDALRPYVHEFHSGVPLVEYPAKLASLNLDLAIAPLELLPFNECKSNLRLLEYGIMGYPVICTDIAPYQGDFPVVRIRNNRHKDWVKAIREMAHDPDACAAAGDRLREHVKKHWMLEDHLDVWMNAWFKGEFGV